MNTRRIHATGLFLLTPGLRFFRLRLERLGLELPVFFQQNLHFAFRLFQFFAAGGRELHAFFEEGERFLQGNFSLFQFLNYFLQSLEALLELGQRVSPVLIVILLLGLAVQSILVNSRKTAKSFFQIWNDSWNGELG